ncbi:Phospho-2-dehydro-3-deoxyheptonate aldolase [Balamuthia mandrillaris]
MQQQGKAQESREEWSPYSWKGLPIKHQPEYEDPKALQDTLEKVAQLPPIVHPMEVNKLKQCLKDACEGRMFILQGGDCAERFIDCNKTAIEKKFKILLQMSLIIIWGSRIPVCRVARMAGQFAKPRSADFEEVDGKQIHTYKGDSINGYEPSDRKPDPQRLLSAYFHAVTTCNWLRAMITGGVSDLHAAASWELSNVVNESTRQKYQAVVHAITDGLSFLSSIQAETEATRSVFLFTAHEGLLLDYEAALTTKVNTVDLLKGSAASAFGSMERHRQRTNSGKVREDDLVDDGEEYYNLGSHFLWIGDRTRQLDGAHVEYFRGIANPIGVKVGPSMQPEELQAVIRALNPNKEPGRLTLITRYGASKIADKLPAHIRAAQETGIPVLWISDPCHGNTEVVSTGLKTRNIKNVMSEMLQAFKIHAENGSFLGGVHLEMTGENVTECIGGSAELEAETLSTNYETFCDPRLNYAQSLDFAFAIADALKENNPNARK